MEERRKTDNVIIEKLDNLTTVIVDIKIKQDLQTEKIDDLSEKISDTKLSQAVQVQKMDDLKESYGHFRERCDEKHTNVDSKFEKANGKIVGMNNKLVWAALVAAGSIIFLIIEMALGKLWK